uniref:Uncharacterized protein n=1 Tax=Lutzomyia longipalpis TaxID=7200 RepID=A0A1B0GIY6_LUTLO
MGKVGRAPSPRSHRGEPSTDRSRLLESPGSLSPSAPSLEGRPRSRAASSHSRTHSQQRTQCGSLTHLESSGATPLLGSHEVLEDEIKRLRELGPRAPLAEIEMQICGASSASSIDQENEAEEIERNRESII